jgi:hypothetical protein
MDLADSLPIDDKAKAVAPLRAWLAKPMTTCKSSNVASTAKDIQPKVKEQANVPPQTRPPEEKGALQASHHLHPLVKAKGLAADFRQGVTAHYQSASHEKEGAAEHAVVRYMFSLCDHNSKSRVDTRQAITFLSACKSLRSLPEAVIQQYDLSQTLSFKDFHNLALNLKKTGGEPLAPWTLHAAKKAVRKWKKSTPFLNRAHKTGSWSSKFTSRTQTFTRMFTSKTMRSGSSKKIFSDRLESSAANDSDNDDDERFAAPAHTIHPKSVTAFRIISVTALLVVYSSLAVPYRLGFDPDERHVTVDVQVSVYQVDVQ